MTGNRKTSRHHDANEAKTRLLVRTLVPWYSRNHRRLPWRKTRDPYRILVSEIMLQQTQVSRVVEKYGHFLERFPTLAALARARKRSVVIAWRGLGYNNRAVRLHELARMVVKKHGGGIPSNFRQLSGLPGIGRYTANALLSLVFGQDTPVVDVNVRRVLSRVFWPMRTTPTMRKERDIRLLADRLVPRGRAAVWNQALMDLGATVCTAHAPRCAECPASRACASAHSLRTVRTGQPKREPSFNGLPNRIYRGRVIEMLRHGASQCSWPASTVARKVVGNPPTKHAAWFTRLLKSLERDGLIVVRGNGSLSSARVSLA